MDDNEIIRLYIQRNQLAIEETDRKYKRYLYRIAYNILANENDVEECINDTYISAWNNIKQKNPDNLKLYLTRIIKNKALNIVEKNCAEKRGGGEIPAVFEELEDVLPAENNPESIYIDKINRKLIEEFLASLEENDRKIFVRRYWFFENVRDIAKRYEVSVIYINLRLHRTRKRLKKYMIDNGYVEM